MALPTVDDVKLVLRIENDVEDTTLQAMLDRACALVVGHLGRPYEAIERTWVDEGGRVRAYGRLRALTVPVTPIDPASLEIVDDDGTTLVAGTDYRAPRAWDGVVRAMPGMTFSIAPYTLTANVGLAASFGSDGQVDYETVIEPVLAFAVIDTVADWYQRRNPAALSEGAGGGVITQWQGAGVGLTSRACEALDQWKLPRIA